MSAAAKDLAARMVAPGASLVSRGLSGGASGNMSARLPNGALLLTATGASLGGLTVEGLSLFDPGGLHVSGGRPTKEAARLFLLLHGRAVRLLSPAGQAELLPWLRSRAGGCRDLPPTSR